MDRLIDTTIVVSRYKENLDWLNSINTDTTDIIVINKGDFIDIPYNTISMPNVGREAQSFVFYLSTYYDILTKHSILLQANPFDHFPDLIEYINSGEHKNSELVAITEKSIYIAPGEGTQTFVENIFDMNFTGINFPCGAQYSVDSSIILSRPKSFWDSLLTKMPWKEDGFLPYFFERCWPIIYSPDIKIKDNYLETPYFQFDN